MAQNTEVCNEIKDFEALNDFIGDLIIINLSTKLDGLECWNSIRFCHINSVLHNIVKKHAQNSIFEKMQLC